MADYSTMITLESVTGESIQVEALIASDGATLIFGPGDDKPAALRVDQGANREALRRLADVLYELRRG